MAGAIAEAILEGRRVLSFEDPLEVDLPEIERRQAEITSWRADVEKLEPRRDAMAAFGSKPIPIPTPDAFIPLGGSHVMLAVEPLKSKETAAALAKRVQVDIDYLARTIRDSEREIQRLLKRGRS